MMAFRLNDLRVGRKAREQQPAQDGNPQAPSAWERDRDVREARVR
jgi:hypothetical protein